jgi:hypothetical protein
MTQFLRNQWREWPPLESCADSGRKPGLAMIGLLPFRLLMDTYMTGARGLLWDPWQLGCHGPTVAGPIVATRKQSLEEATPE